jgi:hypothetical protein
MTFGVVSWNFCVWTNSRNAQKVEFLSDLDWSIALLQEVSPEAVEAIRSGVAGVTVVSGVDLLRAQADPAQQKEPAPRVRNFGCAILARNGAKVVESGLIPSAELDPDSKADLTKFGDASLPLVESLLWAQVELPDGTVIEAVAAHPPHSAGKGEDRAMRIERKLRTYAALERWVKNRPKVVVGIDGNAWIDTACMDPFDLPAIPNTKDDPQQAVSEFFYDGPERHGLQDVYRDWLHQDPARIDAIRSRRPLGPLAVTFVRGTTRKVADRFDVIMASPTLAVQQVDHSYEDSVSAGSDHSYVIAQFDTP